MVLPKTIATFSLPNFQAAKRAHREFSFNRKANLIFCKGNGGGKIVGWNVEIVLVLILQSVTRYYGYNYISFFMTLFSVAMRFGHLFQRIASVYDCS